MVNEAEREVRRMHAGDNGLPRERAEEAAVARRGQAGLVGGEEVRGGRWVR